MDLNVHFIHPHGLICFLSHFEFIDALLHCQDQNIDVLDFQLHGFDYVAVFSVHGFFSLVHYCDGEAFHFAKFILL